MRSPCRNSIALFRLAATVIGFTAWTHVRALTVPAGRRDAFRAQAQQQGSQLLLRLLRVQVRVFKVGADELRPDEPHSDEPHASRPPAMIVSNHLGVLDPFVQASQRPLSLVAKDDIRRWPVGGWVTRTMGAVFASRARAHAVTSFVAAARQKAAAGVPVAVFPEGTTNRTKELLPFKTGAFEMVAGETDASILPVYILPVSVDGEPDVEKVTWDDSDVSFPAHVWALLGLRVVEYHMYIGEPLEVEGQGRKELARKAEAAVRQLAASPAVGGAIP